MAAKFTNDKGTNLDSPEAQAAFKTALDLQLVDNTADVDKPVSAAAQLVFDSIEDQIADLVANAVQTEDLAAVATSGQYADLDGKPVLGTAASANVAASGNAAAGEVVKGDDSRLTDARSPTTHANTHINGADDIPLATGAEKGLMPSASVTKLASIETNADVTNNARVNAAGATMNADTTLVGNAWFLDDDTMADDDDTKVPSQQSVKAYVDGALSLSAILDLLGLTSYATIDAANAGILAINTPFYNTTNNRIEITTSDSA